METVSDLSVVVVDVCLRFLIIRVVPLSVWNQFVVPSVGFEVIELGRVKRKMNEYTPQIFKKRSCSLAYGTMVVELRKCPVCEKWMLKRPNPFPNMDENGEDLQIQRAGWVYQSNTENNNMDYICEECKTHERVKFTCAICGEERTSSEVQEQFGCPAEYLCKECYSKVSAKEWDVKVEELDAKHHWDFD